MIIILGPPGSGKGTQSKLIALQLNRDFISAGDTLKAYINSNLELKEHVNRGGVLETEDINQHIMDTAINISKDIILDGFPRTFLQSKFICNREDYINIIEVIIILEIDLISVKERLYKRFVCNTCLQAYNFEATCCNYKTQQRIDDMNDEAIKNRWNAFNDNINIVINEFKKKNIKIININSNRKKEEITEDILINLKRLDIK